MRSPIFKYLPCSPVSKADDCGVPMDNLLVGCGADEVNAGCKRNSSSSHGLIRCSLVDRLVDRVVLDPTMLSNTPQRSGCMRLIVL